MEFVKRKKDEEAGAEVKKVPYKGLQKIAYDCLHADRFLKSYSSLSGYVMISVVPVSSLGVVRISCRDSKSLRRNRYLELAMHA